MRVVGVTVLECSLSTESGAATPAAPAVCHAQFGEREGPKSMAGLGFGCSMDEVCPLQEFLVE